MLTIYAKTQSLVHRNPRIIVTFDLPVYVGFIGVEIRLVFFLDGVHEKQIISDVVVSACVNFKTVGLHIEYESIEVANEADVVFVVVLRVSQLSQL